jgi:ATP-binding cassette subfamily B protein
LGSILAGIRAPTSGLLLFGGLDRAALGSRRWRRRVVLTPQFHENHLVTETLAFNLLMGRPWPAPMGAMAEATELCVELGLGPLLERMPAGILQMVGEGGWKLSHGEQSRVMLARAILQHADVVVLDESFAALDPETMAMCLETVIRRAPALVVIAHP